jgi:hypothetical protein
MKQITRNTLMQIMSKPLFGNVGKLDSQRVVAVGSWQQASEECSKIEYNNLCNSARNQLSSAMHVVANEVYNQTWNVNVDEIKAFLKCYIDTNVNSLELPEEIISRIHAAVRWDLMLLGMEAEYSEYVKPAFFTGLSYWYNKGHFPCGWQGEYPQGKLMVY